jgi:forkhead box protein K
VSCTLPIHLNALFIYSMIYRRTQITIANQTFHFLLPSAPDSDDSQSISSALSSRDRSLSVDIMSMSPTTAPRSISAGLSDGEQGEEYVEESKPRVGKKRKKINSPPKRGKGNLDTKKIPPGELPSKPSITYANLSYRAIKSHGGRAALQDICRWISANYEWYRLNEGTGWEV